MLKMKQINSINASSIFVISKKNPTYKISSAEKKLLFVTHILLKDVAEIITSKFPGTLETEF